MIFPTTCPGPVSMADVTADELLDSIDEALERLDSVFADEGRDDLCARVAGARARLDRPTTVVCVVGEFKQGKSSLVNAIVGADVCPVDDDLATSVITLLRHGDEPSALVRRRVNGESSNERVSVDQAARFISEVDGAHEREQVERVDISLPSPALATGLALVDTPGAGGVRHGHGAATLAFLPFADGMVFVTDATAELSQPELDFLAEARSRCPYVIVALTKIDIAPEWRRIRALDEGHFARLGLDIAVYPVSSELHRAEHGEAGGVDALLAALHDKVVEPARSASASRIGTEVAALVRTVQEGLERRRVVLAEPSALAALEAEVAAAVARIEHLRGPGARWSIALGDRMADLSNDAGFQFRGALRDLMRSHEEAIESLKSTEQWEAQAEQLQADLAAIVTRLFTTIEDGRRAVRDELLDLLTAEDEALGGTRGALSLKELAVADLWRGKKLETTSLGGKAVQTGLTGLRGAQSGIMLFGMTSQFLPAAAATLLVSNPVLLAVGAVFGGYQLFEDRKRKLTMRRQTARTQLRQFTDDVQFEVTNELGVVLRTVQRELRDEFSSLLGELQRTWTESVAHAKASLAQGAEERAAELRAIEHRQAALVQVDATVSGAVASLGAAPGGGS